MEMDMYMTFWKGDKLAFLFERFSSTDKGSYWLGLTVTFIVAILFELL